MAYLRGQFECHVRLEAPQYVRLQQNMELAHDLLLLGVVQLSAATAATSVQTGIFAQTVRDWPVSVHKPE